MWHMPEYEDVLKRSRANANLDEMGPLAGVPHTFRNLGLELYMCFPCSTLQTWRAGATPWKLRQSGFENLRHRERASNALHSSSEVAGSAKEMEWDCHGNAEFSLE